MALKIRKALLNIEFTSKYKTYAHYIKYLLEDNPNATVEEIKEFFLENFNIMNKDALILSMGEDSKSNDKAEALLGLELELKEHLLKFILGEDTDDTKLTQKKLTGGISIFKDIVEDNAEELKKIYFNDEIISKNKTAYVYRDKLYYEEQDKFLVIDSKNGQVSRIDKSNFKKYDKEVKKVSIKTFEDGQKTYIQNKVNQKYISINEKDISKINETQLENNRKTQNYYKQNKAQKNVTLYDKIIKDIDIVLEKIKVDKGFPMKDYLGILKLMDFITKDILQDKSYGLIGSITGDALFMEDDGKLALLDTYSNMIYGQGFEIWNMYKMQLQNKNLNIQTLEVIECNEFVESIRAEAKSKDIEIKTESTLASVDIIATDIGEEVDDIKLVEVKHFRPNFFGDFKVYQKNPNKIIAKMGKLVEFTELLAEVRTQDGKTTTSSSNYDISTYDKDGKVFTAAIDMRDYITFFQDIGEAIKEEFNKVDEEGNKVLKQSNNRQNLTIIVKGVEIGIMIDKARGKRIDLSEKNIMDKGTKGISTLQFTYENNEAYINLLEMYGATTNISKNTEEILVEEEVIKQKSIPTPPKMV
jgi:hypothetical protein